MTTIMQEIYDQPVALRQTVANAESWMESLATIKMEHYKRIIFTGMGASFNSTFPSRIYLMEHNITVLGIETAELLYYYRGLLDSDTLLVIISQSGESIETQKLIHKTSIQAKIVCITNTPQSTLGQGADITINLNAGEELTIASKTFICTQAVLYLMAHILSGQDIKPAMAELNQVADYIESGLAQWQIQAEELADQFPTDANYTFIGRGPSQASTKGAALALRETAKVTTDSYTGGGFRHGSIEAIDDKTICIMFAGTGRTQVLNLAMANDLADVVNTVIAVGNNLLIERGLTIDVPSVNEWLNPMIEIVPFQLLSVALAEHRGIEAGTFRFISKVIDQE
jgi:glutamine---fructose-6-phosphate transaminase (isomerizing)